MNLTKILFMMQVLETKDMGISRRDYHKRITNHKEQIGVMNILAILETTINNMDTKM